MKEYNSALQISYGLIYMNVRMRSKAGEESAFFIQRCVLINVHSVQTSFN